MSSAVRSPTRLGTAEDASAMPIEALADLDVLLQRRATDPLIRERISEDAFVERALTELEHRPYGCLLDSAGPVGARARTSLQAEAPLALFYQDTNRVTLRPFGTAARGTPLTVPLSEFAAWVEDFHGRGYGDAGPALFPLLTYEAFNPYVNPSLPHPTWGLPEAVWLLAGHTAVYDREVGLLTRRHAPETGEPPAPPATEPTAVPLGWRESEIEYGEKIRQVQHHIFEGNFYQANLSQRFLGETPQPPTATYRLLRDLNPSPFMGLFRIGETWVVSGSPERLVDKRGAHLSARPIAGTKPRFAHDTQADAASRHDLCTSEKERAEHLMLVDLLRNDLGRVSAPGTVRVAEFSVVETYSHVHHLVSQIVGELADDADLFDLIAAVFPGGTITGAPKIACMQTLVALEREARGPYTGSFGYIDSNGHMDLNILIRTMIQHGRRVCFHGGGGIVADSCHDAEYLETRQKCAALMEALNIRA